MAVSSWVVVLNPLEEPTRFSGVCGDRAGWGLEWKEVGLFKSSSGRKKQAETKDEAEPCVGVMLGGWGGGRGGWV